MRPNEAFVKLPGLLRWFALIWLSDHKFDVIISCGVARRTVSSILLASQRVHKDGK